MKLRYGSNPFHNFIHAFDVIQMTNFINKTCNFMILAHLDPNEIASMYLAACVHDYDHPYSFIVPYIINQIIKQMYF